MVIDWSTFFSIFGIISCFVYFGVLKIDENYVILTFDEKFIDVNVGSDFRCHKKKSKFGYDEKKRIN